MAISANTLFHFTRFNYLKSILKTGVFYPRYSFELFLNYDEFIVMYPMVCFCDIPLSQISNHAEKYHRNGIGLKKEWGIAHGINPVFYIQSDSVPNTLVRSTFQSIFERQQQDENSKWALITDNKKLVQGFLDLTSYFKLRKGKEWDKSSNSFLLYKNSKTKYKETDFYDEREWRFVPQLSNDHGDNIIPINFRIKDQLYENGQFDNRLFNQLNKKLEDYELPFKPEDVKYIIVSRTDYVNKLATWIHKECSYSKDQENLLISKIIPLRQVKEDF